MLLVVGVVLAVVPVVPVVVWIAVLHGTYTHKLTWCTRCRYITCKHTKEMVAYCRVVWW